MDLRLKHRLVGAVVLIAIGVIFIPMLLDGPPPAPGAVTLERIPPAPDAEFVPRRVDLALPPPAPATPSPPTEPVVPARVVTDEAVEVGTSGAWVIQIGSFSQADNARALRDRLRKAGYTAFDERIVGADGKPTTRVRIGPELDRATLERQLAKLHKEPDFAAAIILRHP